MHLGLSGVLVCGLIFWATPDLSLEYFVRVQGLHVLFGVFFISLLLISALSFFLCVGFMIPLGVFYDFYFPSPTVVL